MRILTFGRVEGRLMAVLFARRDENRRIISARKAIGVSKGASKQKSIPAAEMRETDWSRFDAITDEEIEASVRTDPDAPPLVDDEWFATATLVLPRAKEQISIRLDRDVLEHFRRYPRYQTRINAILRAVMEHEKKAG